MCPSSKRKHDTRTELATRIVNIRSGVPDDAPSIASLWRASTRKRGQEKQPNATLSPIAVARRVRIALMTGSLYVWVAEADEKTVGFVSCAINKVADLRSFPELLQIDDLVVAPALRRAGVAAD